MQNKYWKKRVAFALALTLTVGQMAVAPVTAYASASGETKKSEVAETLPAPEDYYEINCSEEIAPQIAEWERVAQEDNADPLAQMEMKKEDPKLELSMEQVGEESANIFLKDENPSETFMFANGGGKEIYIATAQIGYYRVTVNGQTNTDYALSGREFTGSISFLYMKQSGGYESFYLTSNATQDEEITVSIEKIEDPTLTLGSSYSFTNTKPEDEHWVKVQIPKDGYYLTQKITNDMDADHSVEWFMLFDNGETIGLTNTMGSECYGVIQNPRNIDNGSDSIFWVEAGTYYIKSTGIIAQGCEITISVEEITIPELNYGQPNQFYYEDYYKLYMFTPTETAEYAIGDYLEENNFNTGMSLCEIKADHSREYINPENCFSSPELYALEEGKTYLLTFTDNLYQGIAAKRNVLLQKVTSLDAGEISITQTTTAFAKNNYFKLSLDVKEDGIYEIYAVNEDVESYDNTIYVTEKVDGYDNKITLFRDRYIELKAGKHEWYVEIDQYESYERWNIYINGLSQKKTASNNTITYATEDGESAWIKYEVNETGYYEVTATTNKGSADVELYNTFEMGAIQWDYYAESIYSDSGIFYWTKGENPKQGFAKVNVYDFMGAAQVTVTVKKIDTSSFRNGEDCTLTGRTYISKTADFPGAGMYYLESDKSGSICLATKNGNWIEEKESVYELPAYIYLSKSDIKAFKTNGLFLIAEASMEGATVNLSKMTGTSRPLSETPIEVKESEGAQIFTITPQETSEYRINVNHEGIRQQMHVFNTATQKMVAPKEVLSDANIYSLVEGATYEIYITGSANYEISAATTYRTLVYDYDEVMAFVASGGAIHLFDTKDEMVTYKNAKVKEYKEYLASEDMYYYGYDSEIVNVITVNGRYLTMDSLGFIKNGYDMEVAWTPEYIKNISVPCEQTTYGDAMEALAVSHRWKAPFKYSYFWQQVDELLQNLYTAGIDNVGGNVKPATANPTTVIGKNSDSILLAEYLPRTVLIQKITLSGANAVDVGASIQLSANAQTLVPYAATTPGVRYASSDPNIASVDANGKVTGVAAGTVTITCSSMDGNASTSKQITVNGPVATPQPTPVQVTDTTTKATVEVQTDGTAEYVAPTDTKAKKVTIPSEVVDANGVAHTVRTISDGAFKGNKTVTTVTIPKTIETIGANAFKNCTNLKTVTLPTSVEKIGNNAFSGCKNLKTITIKSKTLNANNISKKAFSGIKTGTVIKVPKKKLKEYTKLFQKKGLSKKVKIKGM